MVNDDGVAKLDFLARIRDVLAQQHEVLGFVIPRENRTGCGGYLRISERIPYEAKTYDDSFCGYVVDGYSAECVYLATELYKGRFDCFVAVNVGNNLGTDIFNSSTVLSVVQGYWLGYPGLAVSVDRESKDFAEGHILEAMQEVEKTRGVFSLNFPRKLMGSKLVRTQLGAVTRDTKVHLTDTDFEITDNEEFYHFANGTDTCAYLDGLASLTDLRRVFGGGRRSV